MGSKVRSSSLWTNSVLPCDVCLSAQNTDSKVKFTTDQLANSQFDLVCLLCQFVVFFGLALSAYFKAFYIFQFSFAFPSVSLFPSLCSLNLYLEIHYLYRILNDCMHFLAKAYLGIWFGGGLLVTQNRYVGKVLLAAPVLEQSRGAQQVRLTTEPQ